MVAELYDLIIVEDSENIYAEENIKEELTIKTHYESLDIAQSKKIHYLKFTLPSVIKNIDEQLHEILKADEKPD